MDHHGWYNRKDQQLLRIESIIILTALGPPGGGRTSITARMVRHFNLLAYTEMDQQTISHIFNSIVDFFMKSFVEEVKEIKSTLVGTVINVYDTIKLNLLPTPKKSHYTFNLRDISKVFQGICSASMKECNSKNSMVRLWYHEIFRVFGDRLINGEDRKYLQEQLVDSLSKFGCEEKEILR